MKIGELAEQTGVAPRLIRYYEQQGLLSADRESNGYRSYGQGHVEQVARVASLVQSGLPTRVIKALLEAESVCAVTDTPVCSPELVELLAAELEGVEKRISCLSQSRDTIKRVLAQTAGA